MKNQKSVQSVKSSNEIVSNKSAATPSGEIVKFDEAGMPYWVKVSDPSVEDLLYMINE